MERKPGEKGGGFGVSHSLPILPHAGVPSNCGTIQDGMYLEGLAPWLPRPQPHGPSHSHHVVVVVVVLVRDSDRIEPGGASANRSFRDCIEGVCRTWTRTVRNVGFVGKGYVTGDSEVGACGADICDDYRPRRLQGSTLDHWNQIISNKPVIAPTRMWVI